MWAQTQITKIYLGLTCPLLVYAARPIHFSLTLEHRPRSDLATHRRAARRRRRRRPALPVAPPARRAVLLRRRVSPKVSHFSGGTNFIKVARLVRSVNVYVLVDSVLALCHSMVELNSFRKMGSIFGLPLCYHWFDGCRAVKFFCLAQKVGTADCHI
jgi:hypothetical protein